MVLIISHNSDFQKGLISLAFPFDPSIPLFDPPREGIPVEQTNKSFLGAPTLDSSPMKSMLPGISLLFEGLHPLWSLQPPLEGDVPHQLAIKWVCDISTYYFSCRRFLTTTNNFSMMLWTRCCQVSIDKT